MIRHAKVFTNEEGVSEEIQYTIIDKVDGEVIVKEWSKELDQEIQRNPTADEILAWQDHESGPRPDYKNVSLSLEVVNNLKQFLESPESNSVEGLKAALKYFLDNIQQ